MAANALLLGNEAIGRGLVEAGCQVMAAYPGTPSSEILPALVRFKQELGLNIYVEWSVNEKSAFEVALAAAMTGKRAAVAMKQVGLNVALDPLMSSAYTGVVGGFVIISCDDPGPESSQTEQDTRLIAMAAKVPVFDPSSVTEAKEFVGQAFEISEKYQLPVILRPTGQLCHARGVVELKKPVDLTRKSDFKKDPARWAATPKFRYLLHKALNAKLKTIADEFSSRPDLNYSPADGKPRPLGIIASGMSYSVVRDLLRELGLLELVPVLRLATPYPFPDRLLAEFAGRFQAVLVLEETGPMVELLLKDKSNILGRSTDHLPSEGAQTPETVARALFPLARKFELIEKEPAQDNSLPKLVKELELPPRPPRLCAGCPHTASFLAIRQALPQAIFTSDIGCYTLGLNMGAVDTCLDMGASINFAAGFYHSYKQDGVHVPIVATIGDSTFFHAGLPALVNAVHTDARFILVILDNHTVAMTGHQPPPHAAQLADSSQGNPVKIRSLLEGIGVRFIKEIDPYQVKEFVTTVKEGYHFTLREEGGLAAIIANHPCALAEDKNSSQRLPEVEITKTCSGCKACLAALDCPALMENGSGRVEIDKNLCVRCGICIYACPQNSLGEAALGFPQDYFLENPFLL